MNGRLVTAVLLGVWLVVHSVTAAPFAREITFTQPDGTQLRLWGEGDEFAAVFETLDGYTVVFDSAQKAYRYARVSPDGQRLQPVGPPVGQVDPVKLGLLKHGRISWDARRQQAQQRYQRWNDGMQIRQRWADRKAAMRTAPAAAEADGGTATDGPLSSPPAYSTTGTKVGLCLLVDFSDDPATVPRADIVDFCNATNYTGYGNNGSVYQYFFDNSNGLLTYTNIVTVYIRAPKLKTFYDNTALDCGDQGRLLIVDAINTMKALPNYATEILPQFDVLTVDGSSRVLACNVYFAGDNSGVWSYGLWPHSWALASSIDLGNGKRVYYYQITDIGSALELGTFCHENGHMLCDYPDIYDYDYDSSGGAGNFCLMNSGGHGVNPVQICAYLKRASGWATTIELTEDSNLLASVSSAGADFNKFYRFQKPGVPTEYYLVENRQRTGRDANIPGGGVLVWHIDELGDHDNQNTNYNVSHLNYEVSLVQADNLFHLQRDINSGDNKDPYYLGNTATGYANQLNDASAPNARWWDGSISGIRFAEFSAKATTMTFLIGDLESLVVSATTINDGLAGNADGYLDPGERIVQTVVILNNGLTNATSVQATLSCAVPGVTFNQAIASYPDIAAGATATNLVAFEYRLDRDLACGTVLPFTCVVATGSAVFTNSFTNTVGQLQYDGPYTNTFTSTDVPLPINDYTTIYSTNSLGVAGVIDDVDVWMHITHTYVADLDVVLEHPDGASVLLVENRGGKWNDFGENCTEAGSTVFDDEAATAISAGSAPFVGAYQPETPLSGLDGRELSGAWRLRVTDSSARDTGTLNCWTMRVIYHQPYYVCSVYNTAPVAWPTNFIIAADASTDLWLTATDADGDPMSFLTNGIPVINPLPYTPPAGFAGLTNFSFVATDTYATSAPTIVSLDIRSTTVDSDGDGLTDWQEALAGTDHLDAASHLRMTSVAASGNDMVIGFASVPGHAYIVEYKDTMNQPSWSPLTNVTAVGSVTAVQDPDAALLSQRFYRVRLSP